MNPFPQTRDHTRIDLSELLEVRYWCKELDITEAELRQAVADAGSSEVCRVRDHLGSQR